MDTSGHTALLLIIDLLTNESAWLKPEEKTYNSSLSSPGKQEKWQSGSIEVICKVFAWYAVILSNTKNLFAIGKYLFDFHTMYSPLTLLWTINTWIQHTCVHLKDLSSSIHQNISHDAMLWRVLMCRLQMGNISSILLNIDLRVIPFHVSEVAVILMILLSLFFVRESLPIMIK